MYGTGKYLIYSNMDIGVQPPFYIKLARQLQVYIYIYVYIYICIYIYKYIYIYM